MGHIMMHEDICTAEKELLSNAENQKLHLLQIIKNIQEIRKHARNFEEIEYFSKMIEIIAEEKIMFYSYKYN